MAIDADIRYNPLLAVPGQSCQDPGYVVGPLNYRESSGGNTRAGPRQSRGDSGTPPLFRSCLSFLSSLSQRRSSVGPLSRASTDHVPRPSRNYARTIQNIRPGCISLAVPEQSWCPQMASLSAIVRLWIPGFELFGRPATQRIAQYRARTVAISTFAVDRYFLQSWHTRCWSSVKSDGGFATKELKTA